MRWAVEIQSTDLEHRNLSDLLAGLSFEVVDASPFTLFTSEIMNAYTTASDVFELAKRVRMAMKRTGTDPNFQLGSVLDFSSNPTKRHAFLEVQSVVHRQFVGSPTLTVGPLRGLNEDELVAWRKNQAEREYQQMLNRQLATLEPVFINDNAAKTHDLLSEAEPTGETLYKIYELAEGHPRNRRLFHSQLGIASEEFRRFQDAVHNPVVTGDWARHAYTDNPRTDRPMSKSEAQSFVRRIADQWLQSLRNARRG